MGLDQIFEMEKKFIVEKTETKCSYCIALNKRNFKLNWIKYKGKSQI